MIGMCIASLLSMFGCGKNDKFITDGPGMENPFAWESFSVSRSDSYAQHNFHITVQYGEDGYVVKGMLLDEDGTQYMDEEADIVLPKEACQTIDALRPQYLPDVIGSTAENTEEEPMILDAPVVQVQVKYVNGTMTQKVDENDFSIQVYQIVLPYFREKFN